MKTAVIPRTERLSDVDFEETSSIVQACAFVLTRLAMLDRVRAIYAKWDREANYAVWKEAQDCSFVFETPNHSVEVLRIENISVFRSMCYRFFWRRKSSQTGVVEV